MKRILIALLLALSIATPALAQFTMTYTFVPGNPILAAEVNTNFSLVSDALNRKGGTITGNIAVNGGITIDGVDISAFLLSTGHVQANTAGLVGSPAFSLTTDTDTGMWFPAAGSIAWSLDGVERLKLNGAGLLVYGNNILDNSGRVPGFNSTYFASLDGSTITGVPEAQILDGTIFPRLAADETITGSWTHALGIIAAAKTIASYTATWNNGATTFTGVDVNVTNTASAAASRIFKVSLAGVEKFSVDSTGITSMTTFQMTSGASNGFVLTSDATGNATWASLPAGSTGVPSGLVSMFETSCPSGWTRRSGVGETYENKMIRGGASYVAVGGGADTHFHTADPAITTSSSDGAHTHTIDIAVTTSSTNGDHTHTVSGSTGNTDISHTHTFSTGGPSSTSTVNSGSGSDVASGTHTHSGTTNSGGGSHSHTLSLTTSGATGGGHAHTFDPPSTATSGASATHTHTTDVAVFNTSTVSNVPAYVQVVVCKKD